MQKKSASKEPDKGNYILKILVQIMSRSGFFEPGSISELNTVMSVQFDLFYTIHFWKQISKTKKQILSSPFYKFCSKSPMHPESVAFPVIVVVAILAYMGSVYRINPSLFSI